jgi:FixJ family two-component response regulator
MIYLIDDDISVRRGFELFLKSEELEYKILEGAEGFLSAFRPGRSHLLILDLSMPGMHGCDLLQKLNNEGIDIPTIVVTAYDDQYSRELCRKFGVKAYLRKPVDSDALIDTIRFLLADSPDEKLKSHI